MLFESFFFFQAEDGIRDGHVTGVQTCALPILVTSDRDFFEQLDPGEQKRFFEESYKLFSKRYGKQNIAYATVHNDEQTPHMHLGVVPMRDGKLQGKNVFNRQELLWLQDKFPEHMKKQGFELKRGERGSDRKHIET